MKILIIGFGSIGKRHYDVLSKMPIVKKIDLVTKQDIGDVVCYKNLQDVPNIYKYDYFIISSETNKHFEQLNFLEKAVSNKLIFCEKPLFESEKDLKIKKNKVFVGYVLRFHPLLNKLKELIKDEKIIFANAKCGQYLPSWRPDIDYRKCYSSKKDQGGGALLDLSHEIDYVQWLCGAMKEIKSYKVKISDLDIDSDDLTILLGKTNKNALINISIDYISKNTHRKLIVETFEYTYELDFIENRLVKTDKYGLKEVYTILNLQKNYMFEKMHLDIFYKKSYACDFQEALDVMKTISTIQEQNK